MAADEIFDQEPVLLCQAKELMPHLPVEKLDVLVVDRIGKNISGPGTDPNSTHTYLPGAPISEKLWAKRAQKVVVLSLTGGTHGAAMGIVMADVTTRRVMDTMDFGATYMNCLTSGVTASGRLPMALDSDRLAIQAAIHTLNGADRSALQMIRIQDTLHLEEIWVSETLFSALRANPAMEILSGPETLSFDQAGNLF